MNQTPYLGHLTPDEVQAIQEIRAQKALRQGKPAQLQITEIEWNLIQAHRLQQKMAEHGDLSALRAIGIHILRSLRNELLKIGVTPGITMGVINNKLQDYEGSTPPPPEARHGEKEETGSESHGPG